MKAHRGDATAPNPQMEMLMKIMPICCRFAFLVQAALGVYFIASSLYRIGQQSFIHRTMKPIQTADAPIDIDPVEDDEPAEKEVSNQQSKKALAAQEARRLAREERSKERNTNRQQRQRKSLARSHKRAKRGRTRANPIETYLGDGRTKKRRK